jgi:hypothetical protein
MGKLMDDYKEAKRDFEVLTNIAVFYPNVHGETTINQAMTIVNSTINQLACEIVDQLADASKQTDTSTDPEKPTDESAQLYKPLWAAVPADEDDDCWRQKRGAFKQVSLNMRYYLFLSKQDAEEHKADGYKVVPVWGE